MGFGYSLGMKLNGETPPTAAAEIDALLKSMVETTSSTDELQEYASDLRMCHVLAHRAARKTAESKAAAYGGLSFLLFATGLAFALRILGIYFR